MKLIDAVLKENKKNLKKILIKYKNNLIYYI